MASPISITVTDDPSNLRAPIKLIRVDGQLDESNVDDQAQGIYKLIEEMPEGTYLIFDLEGLTYMNSKSIGFLADWHQKVLDKKGEILLTRARENILDILNVVGLTEIIRIFTTIDEAKLAILQQLEGR